MFVDLADFIEKAAQIKQDAKQTFIYVSLPSSLREKLEEIGKKALPANTVARDVDHITLVFVPKSENDVTAERLDKLLKELRDVSEAAPVIHAKVQGYGYFDGAMDDGVSRTALVALIDAPGLEDLHVELKSACRRAGFEPSSEHTFVPHATLAYISRGERVKDLPLLDGEFEIHEVMLANRDLHSIPLKRNIGEEAAKAAATWLR